MILPWSVFRGYVQKWATTAEERGKPAFVPSRRAIVAALIAAGMVTAPPPTRAAPFPLKARRVPASGGSGIPVVGPEATWNGTDAQRGGAIPTQSATTTSKPAARFITPTLQAFEDAQFIVGVAADSGGLVTSGGARAATGIASVRFCRGVASTTVTTPSVYTWPDGRRELGYWIKLDRQAFLAQASNPATCYVDVMAEVTANDGTMQTRVIGGKNGAGYTIGSGNWGLGDDSPQRHYPRAAGTGFDFDVTAGSGGTYATLDLALAAVNGAAPTRARITVITSGTQTVTTHTTMYVNSVGYVEITTAASVNLVIKKGTSFDPYNTSDVWDWWPGIVQGHVFPGAGGSVTIDVEYFTNMKTAFGYADRPWWFDRVTWRFGVGKTLNDLAVAWNGSPYPGFSFGHATTGQSFPSYFIGCTHSLINIQEFQHSYTHCTATNIYVGKLNGTRYVAYNNMDGSTYRPTFPTMGSRMTVAYSGTATNAWITMDGTAHSGPGTRPSISCYEDGVLKIHYDCDAASTGYLPLQVGQLVSEWVTYLNAHGVTASGTWTFTAIGTDANSLQGSWFNNAGELIQNIKGTGVPGGAGSGSYNVPAGCDIHSELYRMDANGSNATDGTNDNYLLLNNQLTNISMSTGMTLISGAQCLVIKNLIYTQDATYRSGQGATMQGLGQITIENSYIDTNFFAEATTTNGYVNLFQNVWSSETNKVGGSWRGVPCWVDNILPAGTDGIPAGSLSGTNYTLTAVPNALTHFRATVVNFASKDFRAAPAEITYNTAVSRINLYDFDLQQRAATDIPGPYRKAA